MDESTLPGPREIDQAIASQRAWAVETLAGWVRHASVLGHELPAQEYVAAVLEGLGLEPRLVPVEVDRIRRAPVS